MGFNISQIINKLIPTKPHSEAADGWENPFGTGAGQLVVSSQENWKTRLSRLGATRTYYSGMTTATTAGVKVGQLACRPPKGTQCFVTHASISANGSGLAEIIFSIGSDVFAYRKYITSGNSFDVNLDGVFMLHSGSDLNLNFTPDNANTNYTCSAIWLEVHE
jgi:hypothetical protein